MKKTFTTILLINFLFMQTTNALTLNYNLRLGSKNTNTKGEVSLLQKFLNPEYLQNTPTGIFDKATKKAVMEFQEDNGLLVTGTVGPITRKFIEKMSNIMANVGQATEITSLVNISTNSKPVQNIKDNYYTQPIVPVSQNCVNGTTNFPLCNLCNNEYLFADNSCVPEPKASIQSTVSNTLPSTKVNISWQSQNAKSCKVNNYDVNLSGSMDMAVDGFMTDSIFKIECIGDKNTKANNYVSVKKQCQNSVTVAPYCNTCIDANLIYTNGECVPKKPMVSLTKIPIETSVNSTLDNNIKIASFKLKPNYTDLNFRNFEINLGSNFDPKKILEINIKQNGTNHIHGSQSTNVLGSNVSVSSYGLSSVKINNEHLIEVYVKILPSEITVTPSVKFQYHDITFNISQDVGGDIINITK